MNKYVWKMRGLAKGIDPDLAVQELERIESIYGSLTPENVLSASEPENAVLHKLFEWDNDVAAQQYRLQQARNLINNIEVVIVSDGKPRHVSVYEVVKKEDGRCYKHIETMTPTEAEQVRKVTLYELKRLKNKLNIYKDFENTIRHIDLAAESLFEGENGRVQV